MTLHFRAECDSCGKLAGLGAMRCDGCGGTLSFSYDLRRLSWDTRRAGMMRYWKLLPIADPDAAVTLGEGGTPLLAGREGSGPKIYYKVETANPTGSHKDRQISVAISQALHLGKAASMLVSSGSTGLSNAAYAARAGILSLVCMTPGVPAERIYPLFVFGSRVVQVDAEVDDLIGYLTGLAERLGIYHSTTARVSNPYQAEGAKTIAYEIIDDLGRSPDWVVVPVGGGGTIAAIGRGFRELASAGMIDDVPRLVGAVSRRFNVLETAHARGLTTQSQLQQIPDHGPVTPVQAKLAHAFPPDGADALAEVRATDGVFLSVSDDEALDAQAALGAGEGIYVEPSTGTAAAAHRKLMADGDVGAGDTVVTVLCGSGFRETKLTMEYRPMEPEHVDLGGLTHLLEAFVAPPAAAGTD
jgi:threonine synthase